MKYKSLGPMETVIFEWLLGYNNEPEGPPDDMAIELAALLRGEHMNCEHAQQHKGDYLASCQGCVNEMRLECIQLLAEVARATRSSSRSKLWGWHTCTCGDAATPHTLPTRRSPTRTRGCSNEPRTASATAPGAHIPG